MMHPSDPEPIDPAPVNTHPTDPPPSLPIAEAHQPTIPGLRPAFDLRAALDLIEEHERAASDAEKAYTLAAEKAKSLRKVADAANAALRELIRDLNTRRHEARYESPVAEAPRDAHTGAAGATTDPSASNGGDSKHVDGASREAAEYPNQADTAAREPTGFSPALDAAPYDPYPSPLFDPPEPPWTRFRRLLEWAGADIAIAQIAAWTEAERVEAGVWARRQVDANAAVPQGQSVSITWPKHVSAAHYANLEPAPTRPRRPAT
jgi:hypothetical protein